jgi:hypothetical protein
LHCHAAAASCWSFGCRELTWPVRAVLSLKRCAPCTAW